MSNLNEKMQERLDKWRKHTLAVPSAEKTFPKKNTVRGSKGDYGDVATVEEWEEEIKKSQTRR
jgi:hypothetical protein